MEVGKKYTAGEIAEKIYNALSRADHQKLFARLAEFNEEDEKKKAARKEAPVKKKYVYMTDSDSSSSEEELPKTSVDERDLMLPEEDLDIDSEEDEWAVITLDDDDEEKVKVPPKELVCYRCPTRSAGSFKDVNKYAVHVKRHVFGEHFCCPTCGRPFIKIGHCISHEMRVHGTKVEYDNRDPAIAYAKKYLLEKELRDCETDDDTDCEDPKFYENKVISSSAQYAYRGPPVNHMIESYEIQLHHSRRKSNRANLTARFAIQYHEHNVEVGRDINRLGRFGPKKASPKKAPVKKKSKKADNKKVSNKRPRVAEPKEKKQEPKAKRRKVVYMTSSSSSSSESDDESKDEDYTPGEKIKVASTSKGSSQRGASGKNFVGESALLCRVCRLCNYVWKTEDDLRVHRNNLHANVPLLDLMAVTPVQKPSKKRAKANDKKKPTLKQLLAIVNASKKGPKRRPAYPAPNSTFTEKEKFLDYLGLVNNTRLDLHLKKPTKNLNLPVCSVTIERLII